MAALNADITTCADVPAMSWDNREHAFSQNLLELLPPIDVMIRRDQTRALEQRGRGRRLSSGSLHTPHAQHGHPPRPQLRVRRLGRGMSSPPSTIRSKTRTGGSVAVLNLCVVV